MKAPALIWRDGAAALLMASVLTLGAVLPARAMHLTDLQGKPHTLEAYRGK